MNKAGHLQEVLNSEKAHRKEHSRGCLKGTLAVFAAMTITFSVASYAADMPASFKKKQAIAYKLPADVAPPKIDGKVEEAAWASAQIISDFHQISPKEFAEPSEKTEVRVVYDEDYLYVSGILYDKDPQNINHAQYVLDKAFDDDDQLHVTVDSFGNNRTGYFFQVNPNSARHDALITNVSFNGDWKTIWDVKSAIHQDSWHTEIRIPFKSLSFDPKTTTWGINFGRSIPRRKEIIAWSSQGQDTWEMIPAVSGTVSEIKDVRQGKGLDIKISGVANSWERTIRDPITGAVQDADPQTASEDNVEPSVDIFYKPTPEFTIVGTLNTDFSATEIDETVINLSRFSVLLPEKRDFFLQDSNIFDFAGLGSNGSPFISRKIGLDDEGQQLDVKGGLKVTGRKNNINLGVMGIRQESVGDESVDLFVTRGQVDVFKESAIGFIYTNGDPLSDANATTVGFDMRYRNSKTSLGGALDTIVWWQKSERELLESGDDKKGWAKGASISYKFNNASASLSASEIDGTFEPALGFVNRADIRTYSFKIDKKFWYDRDSFRLWQPSFKYDRNESVLGKDRDTEYELVPVYAENSSGDNVKMFMKNKEAEIEEAFSFFDKIDIAAGEYDFSRYGVELNTTPSRALSGSLTLEGGDFWDGENSQIKTTITARPWSRLLISHEAEVTQLDFADENVTVRLNRLSSEWAINSEWAWFNFIQTDNVSNELTVNSRLRWLPVAGQELFIVLNRGYLNTDLDGYKEIYREDAIKLTYTLRY